jgi:hypothetical protein
VEKDIEIQQQQDWSRFRKQSLDIILDPMIVRSADLWLAGRSGLGGQDPDEVWKALCKNVDSIEAFFDAFILYDRLPLMDYGITYDSNIGFEPESLYRRINETAKDKILVNVHVLDEASKVARNDTIETLKTRIKVEKEQKELLESVKQELSAYDHKWEPDLSELGPLSHEQTLLTKFRYGLLLFGHFATSAGVGHLVQTKRARLFRAGALGAKTPAYEFDAELRRQLKDIVESEEQRLGTVLDLQACPSFLPYLLSKQPSTSADLLKEALKLRQSSTLRDYRSWRRKVVSDWQQHARIDAETERELRMAVRGVARELGIDLQESSSSRVGINIMFLSGEAAPEKLLGWIPPLVRGRRHSKLLMHSIRASREYRRLTTELQHLWSKTQGV